MGTWEGHEHVAVLRGHRLHPCFVGHEVAPRLKQPLPEELLWRLGDRGAGRDQTTGAKTLECDFQLPSTLHDIGGPPYCLGLFSSRPCQALPFSACLYPSYLCSPPPPSSPQSRGATSSPEQVLNHLGQQPGSWAQRLPFHSGGETEPQSLKATHPRSHSRAGVRTRACGSPGAPRRGRSVPACAIPKTRWPGPRGA